MVDTLASARGTGDGAALGAHLATCDACRAITADYASLWADLTGLEVPRPTSGASDRLRQMLAEAEPISSSKPAARGWSGASSRMPSLASAAGRRWPSWAEWTGIAAVLLIGGLAGYAVGSPRSTIARGTPSVAAAAQPEFLLLLHEDSAHPVSNSPADDAQLVADYGRWAQSLRDAGRLIAAEELVNDPHEWLGEALQRGSPASTDRVGGFFLIRARDYAQAREIAASCPHLRHGGRVELRAITAT